MSSGLEIYLLDVTATQALVGSRNDQLLTVIRENYRADLDRDDDYHRRALAKGAPTADEALQAVLFGGPFSADREHAFQYGYAYHRLCSLTGAFLDNSSFMPHRGDWLHVVDAGLRKLGITAVSTSDFEDTDLPAPLPWCYTPMSGTWTHEQCLRALEQFEATKQAVDASGQAPPLEPEVVDAVFQCIGWLRHAATRPGSGIIGFKF
ncbi:hypothetical protein ACIBI4_04325 [Streptomyces sp. NPDC050418]|uniref:DUF7691 family protein n=1 Tax=Streptomyces sp. NPDC050418 TaxID=3365612 RepID=UPI0037AFBB64